MKKLAFAFAAIVAVSFASCGNKTQEAEENVDSTEVEVVEVADSCCAGDSCCAAADSCCAAE